MEASGQMQNKEDLLATSADRHGIGQQVIVVRITEQEKPLIWEISPTKTGGIKGKYTRGG